MSEPVEFRLRSQPGERFWRMVQKVDGSCWTWLGQKNDRGYGVIGLEGKKRKAHRVSWFIHNGPFREDLRVLHRCDVPSCVNPDHLFLGTQGDNVADMAAKGRHGGQRKTHCVNGHEFTEANTYLYRDGRRRSCRTCQREKVARRARLGLRPSRRAPAPIPPAILALGLWLHMLASA